MTQKKLKVLRELNRIWLSRATSWISSVGSLVNPSLPSTSLDSLRNPPPKGSFKIKNAYIPVGRAFLFRELIQDKTTILPSEREDFELMVVSLQKRFTLQFHLLERELSLLFQPVALCESPHELDQLTRFLSSSSSSSSTVEGDVLRRLTLSEQQDREFWILRRVADVARVAGFIEVPQDQVEHAFRAKHVNRGSASLFVDPKDYEIVRFWIRGVHPRAVTNAPGVSPSHSSPVPAKPRWPVGPFAQLLSRPVSQLPRTLAQTARHSLSEQLSPTAKPLKLGAEDDGPGSHDLRFTNVLMAVRGVQDKELILKLYDSAPASIPSRRSFITDTLSLLLPALHFRPMTAAGRTLIGASCLTALACLGVVAPSAWLFTSDPDHVIAWSVAASATAGVIGTHCWAQYWRARAKAAAHLKHLQFTCLRNSGFHSVQNLLKMAVDEELKAAILTYALLLRPSEAGLPLSPVKLGIRAESWIANRLSPKLPLPLPSDGGGRTDSAFTGGSGPLFDLAFDPKHSLQLLRRLGLIRGPVDSPQAIPVSAARSVLDDVHTGSDSGGLSSLWILDPILGDEFKLNLPD